MAVAADNYVTDVGLFNNIKINQTIKGVLLKLNSNLTNVPTTSVSAGNVMNTKKRLSFMKLTKKMKLFYLANTLNKLKNQIVKYNVKKLFQLWHVYHRENRVVKTIVDILFKVPQYDIKTIRRDILQKNKKSGKEKKQRDEICREICKNANLLRVFDRKSFKYCLENFNMTAAALKKKMPVIMCFNKSDIDAMVEACLFEKTFPVYLLPCTISAEVKQMLKNKIPQ